MQRRGDADAALVHAAPHQADAGVLGDRRDAQGRGDAAALHQLDVEDARRSGRRRQGERVFLGEDALVERDPPPRVLGERAQLAGGGGLDRLLDELDVQAGGPGEEGAGLLQRVALVQVHADRHRAAEGLPEGAETRDVLVQGMPALDLEDREAPLDVLPRLGQGGLERLDAYGDRGGKGRVDAAERFAQRQPEQLRKEVVKRHVEGGGGGGSGAELGGDGAAKSGQRAHVGAGEPAGRLGVEGGERGGEGLAGDERLGGGGAQARVPRLGLHADDGVVDGVDGSKRDGVRPREGQVLVPAADARDLHGVPPGERAAQASR